MTRNIYKYGTCKRGHYFSPENTYVMPGTPSKKCCRKCRFLRNEERRGKIVLLDKHTPPKTPYRIADTSPPTIPDNITPASE